VGRYFYAYFNGWPYLWPNRKEGKDSEYENVETEEDDADVEARKEQEEIRKFEEEEKRLMAKGLFSKKKSTKNGKNYLFKN